LRATRITAKPENASRQMQLRGNRHAVAFP
jgi:hypothetical protein